MRLLLLEEKYLELLEKGESLLALQCLRHELNSLPAHHPDRSIQDLMRYVLVMGVVKLTVHYTS